MDEDREQTRAIHRCSARSARFEGCCAEASKRGDPRARTATRSGCLRPLAVVNPYADRLTFLDDRTRTRRDHEKYLTLIDAIALLASAPAARCKTRASTATRALDYIEVTLDDIDAPTGSPTRCWAARSTSCRRRRGACSACSSTSGDARECAAQADRARASYRFSRRELRETTELGRHPAARPPRRAWSSWST